MNVRKKSIIIFGLVFFPLIIAFCIVSQSVLLDSFLRLEQYNVNQNIKRVQSALNNELDFISSKISDWANWDDTYNFMADNNSAYIKSNLNDLTFIGLKINFIVFFSSSGKVILAKGFDLELKKELPLSVNFINSVSSRNIILPDKEQHKRTTGILILNGKEPPVLLVAQGILNSKGEGPARGTLIFGRYLDSQEVENIGKITNLSLKVKPLGDSGMPVDFIIARNKLSREKSTFVQALDNMYICGYMLVNDINNRPALIFRVDVGRDIYRKGKKVIIYFITALIALSLLFSIVAILLLDKLILSRISVLSKSVAGIGDSGGVSLRLSFFGHDEISRLTQDINFMLGKLDSARSRLMESEERYHSLVDNVNSIVLSLDNDCRITFWNKFAVKFFGYSEEEIIGRSVIGTIVPETETGGRSLDKFFRQLCRNPQDYASSINENIKKDGERVWIAWANRPLFNENNEQTGVLCVGNDITEFKRMENRFKSLNKAFLTLGADFERNIKVLTSTCGELLGAYYALYNRISEGLLCSVGKWNTPENYKAIDKPQGYICFDFIKRNQKDIYIVRHLDQMDFAKTDPNVSMFALKTYIGYPVYAFGECIGSLCVVYQKDVEFSDNDKIIIEILATAIGIEEERRVSEEAIKKSRDFYLTLFDRFPTPVWRSASDGRFDYFNKSWLSFTGRNISEEIGQGWIEGVHPDDRQGCLNIYLNSFNEHKSFEREFRLRRFDGEYRRMIDVGTPFYDLKGNFSGYIGSCYDITELKHAHH